MKVESEIKPKRVSVVGQTERWNHQCLWEQARSQVSIFGGAQYIFEGARFLVLLYL